MTSHRPSGLDEDVPCVAAPGLNAERADATEIARRVRDHRGIGDKIDHVRDTTDAEDAFRVRSGTAPCAMASLLDLAMGAFRFARHPDIAAAGLRRRTRDGNRPLITLGM
ncbi:hypothetical protein [Streptomyces spongiae]|uniref:hypothetical protein n=1 Tax=Streptomyces spongiae TaxID=565072 RepID=UPI001883A0D6|nr:hypothetical protein [Streptomyces spongiae]